MAEQKVWIGSIGPFLYDDDDLIDDADGDMPGSNHSSLVTTGQMIINQSPTLPGHVLRANDVGSAAVLTYSEAVVTIPVTGFTAALNWAVRYAKLGNNVFIHMGGLTGTASLNTCTAGPLPAEIRPVGTIYMISTVVDGGVTKITTSQVLNTGMITIHSTPGITNGWATTGTRTLYGAPFYFRTA